MTADAAQAGSCLDRVADAVARHGLRLLERPPTIDRYRLVFDLARP